MTPESVTVTQTTHQKIIKDVENLRQIPDVQMVNSRSSLQLMPLIVRFVLLIVLPALVLQNVELVNHLTH